MLDVWLRTEWLSCRKNSVLRCVERYSAAAAANTAALCARCRKWRKPWCRGEVEALNRRLSAANAEIRRYQTRLFACEREMVALRQENAELEALCDQARKTSCSPQSVPSPGARSAGSAGDRLFPVEQSRRQKLLPGRNQTGAAAAPQEEEQPSPFEQRTGSPPPPSISFRWTSYINWKP